MNDRAADEEVIESEPYEIRIRLKPDPKHAELYDTMLTMLAELARARHYVERCDWRVPHPVKTRYCVKALRQVERQIAAEFERLYDGPVEIDPPTTEPPATEPALQEEEENGTMGQTQERININGSEEPGRIRRAASATWQFVKNPKVWGTAAAVAGIAAIYVIVRAVANGGDEPAAAPSVAAGGGHGGVHDRGTGGQWMNGE
jgi:hypothetical protein